MFKNFFLVYVNVKGNINGNIRFYYFANIWECYLNVLQHILDEFWIKMFQK